MLQHGWSLESAVQNTLRTRSPVFTGSVFQSASCSKSRYLATEQWTAVRPRICCPTSPASLMCHLDWDSDHLTLTSDQVIVPSFNLATVGRRTFPVFAANLWNSLPAHYVRKRLASQAPGTPHLITVADDFPASSEDFCFSAFLSWPYYLTSYCGPSSNFVIRPH